MVDSGPPTPGGTPGLRLLAMVVLLILGGMVLLAGIGLLGIERAGVDPGRRAPAWASLGVTGIIAGGALLTAGLASLVLSWGGGQRLPMLPHGSHRSVIASTALVIAVAVMAAAVYFVLAPAQIRSAAGFTFVAYSLPVAMVGMTYLQGVRPGFVTIQSLGLQASLIRPGVYAGLVAAFILVLLSAANALLLSALGAPQPQAEAMRWLKDVPLQQFLLVAAAGALAAPVAEELFFRGYIFNAYIAEKGTGTAYVASAVIFGLVHGQLTLFPAIFLGGLVLAHMYRRTGTIIAPMVAHVINNGLAFASLRATGEL